MKTRFIRVCLRPTPIGRCGLAGHSHEDFKVVMPALVTGLYVALSIATGTLNVPPFVRSAAGMLAAANWLTEDPCAKADFKAL